MMARTDRAKRTDPARADSYAEVGRRLLHAARAISGQGDARHASALAILAVHCVIAHADAVAIHSAGKRSTAAEHAAVLALLRDVLGNRLPDRIAKEIQRVIAEKDKFEYQGYVATLAEARALLDRAEREGAWCEEWLALTPRMRA
ncbi:MAG: hypothetical protein KJT01_00765 [Gemmatimonadetes bacterium]|nr:hypothetical protein [Gemmatimonadota bacterium]